ncbi:NrfD/PsrC family molybdoenzyme membrane anchor subunit [Vulgatibacter sp.]|uniref:NrfD/PsrC family molybdoenzyme membrane anchor subunit n=1 Tax=Vulgatibacter sp. TaxID=1971226 RepID=UPI00356620C9
MKDGLAPELEGDDPGDGRNVATDRTVLEGEGAQQIVRAHGANFPVPERGFPVEHAPSETFDREAPTYHGLPMLKDPVWVASIAAYFYVGGVAGCSAALAASVDLAGDAGLERLGRRTRWIAAGGAILGTGLLIHDLGRPARFLHMLRVFRPTSPMNLGAWLLAAFGGASAAGAVLGGRGAIGRSATLAAGVLGPPLATYTAALLANTAVPVWQQGRRTLPFLFGASSVASTAALLQLLPLARREERTVRALGIAGKAAELVAAEAVEREVGQVERAALPLRQGISGTFWKAAKLLNAASLALDLLPTGEPWRRKAAGALGTAAALALRYSVFRQGKASTHDVRATTEVQRAGHGAAEVTAR